MPDYSIVDNPSLLQYLFYPQPNFHEGPFFSFDQHIPVDQEVTVHCRFYAPDKNRPSILFFHGNGEVVSDYDEIAPLYLQFGLNLIVADYRGYGFSTGTPTFTDLCKDAHQIWHSVKAELISREFNGGFWVMGRSLGSLSALELASSCGADFRGLIIESGFISITRLIKNFGLGAGIDLEPLEQANIAQAQSVNLPTLIIHGEYDNLVPLREARLLMDNLGSSQKQLLVIPDADHNDIMYVGFEQYFNALQRFIK